MGTTTRTGRRAPKRTAPSGPAKAKKTPAKKTAAKPAKKAAKRTGKIAEDVKSINAENAAKRDADPDSEPGSIKAGLETRKSTPKRKAASKPAKAAKPKTKKAPAKKTDGKLSQLDAAAIVLAKADEPMNAMDLVNAMTKQKLWTSEKGLTPWATLSAAVRREIKVKGADSRFRIAGRGLFALAKGGAK